MAAFLQVCTATATREQAVELARSVVSERLAAGAQIVGPVISAFWHDGEFGTGEEWLKATRARYPQLEAHLLAQRPWQNPPLSLNTSDLRDWVPASWDLDRWVDRGYAPMRGD
ncbi:divalent-cation tolerance protein CutA, partial [Streptomyces sp. NPDC050523]|uniref:divalent-cation tolerance protein CutA n=1 Tax=Streptomyces sp. NPDC050523 TaxID=3365622 RepID=UPI0037ABD5BB